MLFLTLTMYLPVSTDYRGPGPLWSLHPERRQQPHRARDLSLFRRRPAEIPNNSFELSICMSGTCELSSQVPASISPNTMEFHPHLLSRILQTPTCRITIPHCFFSVCPRKQNIEAKDPHDVKVIIRSASMWTPSQGRA